MTYCGSHADERTCTTRSNRQRELNVATFTQVDNRQIEGDLTLPLVYGNVVVPLGGSVIVADTVAHVIANLGLANGGKLPFGVRCHSPPSGVSSATTGANAQAALALALAASPAASGAVSRGVPQVYEKPWTAVGSGGTRSVTIFATGALPGGNKLEILDVWGTVTNAGAGNGTFQLFPATGGSGTTLTDAMSTASTGLIRQDTITFAQIVDDTSAGVLYVLAVSTL